MLKKVAFLFICFNISFNILIAEQLVVSFDRDNYLTSDNISYSMALMKSNNEYSNLSKIFQISILSREGKQFSSSLSKIVDGVTKGTLEIPSDLSSDHYVISIVEYYTLKEVLTFYIPIYNLNDFSLEELRIQSSRQDFLLALVKRSEDQFSIKALTTKSYDNSKYQFNLIAKNNELIELKRMSKEQKEIIFDKSFNIEILQDFKIELVSNGKLISSRNLHAFKNFKNSSNWKPTRIALDKVQYSSLVPLDNVEMTLFFDRKISSDIFFSNISIIESETNSEGLNRGVDDILLPSNPFIWSSSKLDMTNSVEYLSITGQITDGNGVALKQRILTGTISYGDNTLFQSTYTNELGDFVFDSLDFYEAASIKISILGSTNHKDLNLLLKPTHINVKSHAPVELDSLFINPQVAQHLYKMKVKRQYENEFELNEVLIKQNNKLSLNTRGQKFDHSYDLRLYQKFDSMNDLIKELLNPLKLKKKKGELRANLFSQKLRTSFPDQPVFIIDGKVVEDLSEILNIYPEYIKTINIVSDPIKLYSYGPIALNGLVIIETKLDVPVKNTGIEFNRIVKGYSTESRLVINENVISTKRSMVPVILSSAFQKSFVKLPWSGRVLCNFTVPDNYKSMSLLMCGVKENGSYFYYFQDLN